MDPEQSRALHVGRGAALKALFFLVNLMLFCWVFSPIARRCPTRKHNGKIFCFPNCLSVEIQPR